MPEGLQEKPPKSASGPGDSNLGELPEWDLSDLYAGPEDPALQADLADLESRAEAFRGRYEGGLARLSAAGFAGAVEAYQALQEGLGRAVSYAQLLYAGDMNDPRIGQFHQTMQERATAISTNLLFFTLELNKLPEEALGKVLAAPAMARWQPWVRDRRAFRPYQLSDEAERLLHEKYVSGRAAWNRLFDETMAALRFPLDGKELTSTEILDRFTDQDPKVREASAHSFARILGENIRTFTLITNTLAKDKEIEDRWRGFKTPVASRNLANLIGNEVVETLVQAVVEAYPGLSHRYYAMKARWLGYEKLPYWERNAPLPKDDGRPIPWEEARDTVLSAYGHFSEDMAAAGKRFFDAAWIDAPVRSGKAPGAFAHPAVPGAHPYLLLNYQGRIRDVMTLAHELGHGVHQMLASAQGYLLADTPLTLAETASVFGEMLTFQALLRRAETPERRRLMLAGKVEDMLNTAVRQIAFHRFETKVHDARRTAELTADQLGDIWMETQREALGPAFALDGEYRSFWAYIPHFVHVPFYVYAYAFGDCLVNSLYAVYRQAETGFAGKYLEMLRAGGSKRYDALLAPFGLDARDPVFWSQGLTLLSSFIDELEQLA
ncbi:MAG: M3 family oligoendopeptidase [Rhodospirillales bacterium]|nr:M3 family oligoendopeptidase [Rhodospirillales bacterium]